jgi:hypothetical protein
MRLQVLIVLYGLADQLLIVSPGTMLDRWLHGLYRNKQLCTQLSAHLSTIQLSVQQRALANDEQLICQSQTAQKVCSTEATASNSGTT